MRKPRVWYMIVMLVMGAGLVDRQVQAADPGGGQALETAKALSNAYAAVVDQVMPSVVGIQKKVKSARPAPRMPMPDPDSPMDPNELLRRFFEKMPDRQPPPAEGYGSGVIIDREGHIVTNNHVVLGADKLVVEFNDDSKIEAEIVGVDPKTDLAVIKLKEIPAGLKAARLGDSEMLRVGNIVLAIGSPFRLKHTVTTGIVSGKNRHVGMAMYENFIQTDASINPGNSGGPLVNLDGEVVGINTLIHSRSGGSDGIGFAVPINMVSEVVSELIEHGAVTRGWLGVGIMDITPELAQVMPGVQGGVAVTEVFAGTPAGDAGMQNSDVIVEFAGEAPRDSRHLQELVARTRPATKVPVTVVRRGERVQLEVVVGSQPADLAAYGSEALPGPDPAQAEVTSERIGVKVQAVDDRMRKLFDLSDKYTGVVVVKVDPGSPAEEIGIGTGAMILELDQQKTPDLPTFDLLAKGLAEKPTALILFRQGGQNRFAVLKFK